LLVKSHSFSFLPLHVAIRSAAYNIYTAYGPRCSFDDISASCR
jgi:hypothetical protein